MGGKDAGRDRKVNDGGAEGAASAATTRMWRHREWALTPEHRRFDGVDSRTFAGLLESEFRWLRSWRSAALCGPARLGAEIGWYVRSPVTVDMEPVQTIEFDCDPDELAEVARLSGTADIWRRERSSLGTPTTSWLRVYQYRGDHGWENMFIPNGDGTIEWRLGWNMLIPEGHCLLVLPLPRPDLEVPYGVLTSSQLGQMSETTGVSIAVRPQRAIHVERGDDIARLLVITAESIQVAREHDR
jgi:hypothetical protein